MFIAGTWLVFQHQSFFKFKSAFALATGDGRVLYGTSARDGVHERVFTAPSTVGPDTNIASTITDEITFMQVKASPVRNEMIAVALAAVSSTGSSLTALRWNGVSWLVDWCFRTGGGSYGGTVCVDATYISNANTTKRGFDIEYENTSGRAVVLYASGAAATNELKYRVWNGTSWTAEADVNPIRTTGIMRWVELEPKLTAGSNEITALFVDGNADLSALVWDGTLWGTEPGAALETNIENIGTTNPAANPSVKSFDGAYETASGDFLAAWGFANTADVKWVSRSSGGAWGTVTTHTGFPEVATIVDMAPDLDPSSNYIAFVSSDPATADNQCAVWSGTGWPATVVNCDTAAGAGAAGWTTVGTGFVRNGVSKRAIVVYGDAASARLDWYQSDPAGNTWTAGTDFAITGAVSTVTSPIEVVVDPFNTNILMATIQKGTGIHMLKLDYGGGSTFTWSNPLDASLAAAPFTSLYQPFSFAFHRFIPIANAPPATPTLADTPAFPHEQTFDTTPVLGNFSTTDPEGDTLEYEIQWDEDFNFETPVTRTSSNFPGDAGWTAATFASGAAVSYTVQPADTLANDQVYWWRVHARDPSGSGTWSAYSVKRSISIDTSLAVERWSQTTGDQFNTGILTDTEVTAGEVKVRGW